jgi:hypothetical protein
VWLATIGLDQLLKRIGVAGVRSVDQICGRHHTVLAAPRSRQY